MVDNQEETVGICFKVVIYICTDVKLLNLRRPLGAKVWDWDIFLHCKRKWWTRGVEFDLKSKLTTEFDLNLQ